MIAIIITKDLQHDTTHAAAAVAVAIHQMNLNCVPNYVIR